MSKEKAEELIRNAQREGRATLSEFEAKQLLAAYDIPVTHEQLVRERTQLAAAARRIGYPLVMKGCAARIAHKTEKNLVRVDVRNEAEALANYDALMAAMAAEADAAVLVQEMVAGRRELVVGLTRDPQFGACVMFGLGGIFTEILKDITFRKAPLELRDAMEMMHEIKGRKILEAVRGMPAADTQALARILMQVGRIGLELEAVAEIDLNPVILSGAKPVAVDALIVLK
ncbi:MAG: acetate--CoA ligase family protein [Desulfatitalea sp.]